MSSPLVFSGVGLTDPSPHSFNLLINNHDIISAAKPFNYHHHQPQLSSDTSSIGADSSDDEDGEEVQSKSKEQEDTSFASLDSIQESLPIKRGLSNFFSGKSKSFASLSDVASSTAAADLRKVENPINKRRRILMASKARSASYSSLVLTHLPTLLSPDNTVLEEGEEDEEERKFEESTAEIDSRPVVAKIEGLKKSFRSPRSFSLSDLQHV